MTYEVHGIHDSDGIVGRKTFQQPQQQAMQMLTRIIDIHFNEA